MTFFEKIGALVYRPQFFAAHQFEVKKALRFYALLLLIFIGIRLLLSVPGIVSLYREVLFSDVWDEQTNVVANLFPDTLEVSVRDGVFSTNSAEPVIIPLPAEWNGGEEDTPSNLLVIDTTKSIEIGDFSRHDTLLILGQNMFGFYNQEKAEFRIYNTAEATNTGTFLINKEKFTDAIAHVSNVLWWIAAVGAAVWPLFLYFVLFISYLIYLLFGALVVWVGAAWRGHKLTYGKAYLAGIYLLPVPFCYEILSSYGQGAAGNVLFAFSFFLFLMAVLNFPKVVAPIEPVMATPPVTATASASENKV